MSAKNKYRAFLFDMDGTLINSIASAERVWGAWAVAHGLDPVTFVPTIHGSRSVDTVARLKLPGVDPAAESAKITKAEIENVDGVVEIPGAIDFVKSLPVDQWAIVTSAPRALAMARLGAAGIPMPKILVTAEDVTQGKPKPDCYLLAAKKLGVPASECLVFEDAQVGVEAGEAAGSDVLVITATHTHTLETKFAKIKNYDKLRALIEDGSLVIKHLE